MAEIEAKHGVPKPRERSKNAREDLKFAFDEVSQSTLQWAPPTTGTGFGILGPQAWNSASKTANHWLGLRISL
jgi:hypothetical protein